MGWCRPAGEASPLGPRVPPRSQSAQRLGEGFWGYGFWGFGFRISGIRRLRLRNFGVFGAWELGASGDRKVWCWIRGFNGE